MGRLEVRSATEHDVDAMAALLGVAWRDTYEDLLPMSVLHGRDAEQDARDLRELVISPPPWGAAVAVRRRSVVGLATFGPPNHSDEPDLLEVYAMYVRSNEIGRGAGRLLLLRTLAHARAIGASELVWFVHADNALLRGQAERRGLSPRGGPLRRQWYGHPVDVFEYRFSLMR